MDGLSEVAKRLVAEGKGVFAADWGIESIGKRFSKIGLENTPDNRKRYRTMLFSTPGLGQYISGVIEFEETVEQGLAEVLEKNGIIPGVKMDRGIEGGLTQGLDGLADRLARFKSLGAKFAKWRAVVDIGKSGREEVEENARRLAEYAALWQEGGLVA